MAEGNVGESSEDRSGVVAEERVGVEGNTCDITESDGSGSVGGGRNLFSWSYPFSCPFIFIGFFLSLISSSTVFSLSMI